MLMKTTSRLQQAIFQSITGMKDLIGHHPRQSGMTMQLSLLRAGQWTGNLPGLDLSNMKDSMTRW